MSKFFAFALFFCAADAWSVPAYTAAGRSNQLLGFPTCHQRSSQLLNLKMQGADEGGKFFESRRHFLKFAAAGVIPLSLVSMTREVNAEALKPEASSALIDIPLRVTEQIAGGSPTVIFEFILVVWMCYHRHKHAPSRSLRVFAADFLQARAFRVSNRAFMRRTPTPAKRPRPPKIHG